MAANDKLGDADLIARCLERDAEAWEILIRRYQRLIASITFKFGLPSEDASDVLQSVFMALFQQMSILRKQEKLSSWIITVTVRECYKVRRRQVSTHSLDDPEQDSVLEVADTAHGTPDEALLVLERQHFLRQALTQLSEQCRDLLTALFYRDDPAPYADISQKLGIPVASIGPTRSRCLAKLKLTLKKTGFF
jgi:RNA polymerase sigma factor (sigma-70 family)